MAVELIFLLGGAAAVTVGCLIPARMLPVLPNDKLLHFLAFGGMAWLAGRIATNVEELGIWLLGLFLGGWVIETLQRWVPGRNFCWRDIAANTAGILAAAIFSPVLLS